MRLGGRVGVLLAVMATAVIAGCGGDGDESETDQVEAAVDSYLGGLASGDNEQACAVLGVTAQRELADAVGAAAGPGCQDQLAAVVQAIPDDQLAELQQLDDAVIESVEVDGEEATVTVDESADSPIELQLVDDEWRLTSIDVGGLSLTAATAPEREPAPEPEPANGGAPQSVQEVALEPVADASGSGTATFSLASGNKAFLELAVEGLAAAAPSQTYVVWLALTDGKGYPLSPIEVESDGSFQDRFSIPAAVLPVVARTRAVTITLAAVSDVRDAVRDAIQSTSLVIDLLGDPVLTGTVSRN